MMALICQWLNKISDSDSALKKELGRDVLITFCKFQDIFIIREKVWMHQQNWIFFTLTHIFTSTHIQVFQFFKN